MSCKLMKLGDGREFLMWCSELRIQLRLSGSLAQEIPYDTGAAKKGGLGGRKYKNSTAISLL